MRSTGQVGPAWTMPWMPVPGWAAGVPQAATIRARAIDTIRNVIDNLEDMTPESSKSSARFSRP